MTTGLDLAGIYETTWQPIATAPRDGTAFIAIRFGRESDPTYNVVYFDEEEDRGKTYPWQMIEGSAYHRDFFTHWQPLPAPPASAAREAGGEE